MEYHYHSQPSCFQVPNHEASCQVPRPFSAAYTRDFILALICINTRTSQVQTDTTSNIPSLPYSCKTMPTPLTTYNLNLATISYNIHSFFHSFVPSFYNSSFYMTTVVYMCPLSTNDLLRIFEKLDRNGDGQVSLEELSWLLERIGMQFSLHELESLVGKPSLDFNEFLFFYKSISMQQNNTSDDNRHEDGNIHEEVGLDEDESDLVKAFSVFDLNGDGFISCEELESVLRRLGVLEENSSRDCRTMIHVYDTNLDGLLDFQEFKNMMFQNTIS